MKTFRRWAPVLAAAALAVAGSPARGDLNTALAALDRGEVDAARTDLKGEVARLSFYQSLAETGEARLEAAKRALEMAPPGTWLSAAAEAVVADGEKRLEDAVAAARRATSLAPNEPRLWNELGDLYREQQDLAEARAAYERATALNPTYATALVSLGDVLRAVGDFNSAYNAYNHAPDADGHPTSALVGRAASRLYIGDAQGALQDLELAVQASQPGNERYRALMGIVGVETYLRRLPAGLDRAEEAARMWGELGRADMVAATMHATARALLETGDPASAAAWYERGWESVSGSAMPDDEKPIWHVRALHGEARCAAVQRDFDRANSLADQARALMAADPANAEHYAWIGPYLDGYLLLQERRTDEAIAALQKSDTKRAQIRLLLADAYARNRDRANARIWYQQALAAATGLDVESVIVRPQAEAWLQKNR